MSEDPPPLRPVIVAIEPSPHDREFLTRELGSRYGDHYDVQVLADDEPARRQLSQLAADGRDVALVLAARTEAGEALLRHVHQMHPHATRVLLLAWNESRAARDELVLRLANGDADSYVAKPMASPDERFHRTVTELLDEWWRLRGRPFALIRIVGDAATPRAHEISDLLQRHDLPYEFLAVDSEVGRQALADAGCDASTTPVVLVTGAAPLFDPSNVAVADAIGARTSPGSGVYDVVVIGGGPAGLAAAVSAGSEGLRTAMVERTAMGGQASTSSLIRNYLGFPRGVSGAELGARALEQAIIFGAHMVYGGDAVGLRTVGNLHVVDLADGEALQARTVVLATGVAYRRLELPSIDALVGTGVFYGAAMTEAPALAGREAYVVGGGNSAGQAAMHLARFARQITILVRTDSLAASMSDYLVTSIERTPNIAVRYRSEISDGGGDGRLDWLDLRDSHTGAVERVDAHGLFVLIGADPCTDWLPAEVARDDWGYIVTAPTDPNGPSCETTLRGVFAVGDVRRGSVKRVASAVGEGSVCIRLVHDHLRDLA